MRTQPLTPLLKLLAATAALLALSGPALAGPPPVDRLPAGPLTGALEIDNARRRPVQIFVDGQPLGEVPARSSRRFGGVVNGERLVSYPVGRRFITERVVVPVNGQARLRVEPLFGHATIENRAGVPMRLTLERRGKRRALPPAEADLGVLRPGERVESQRLAPGSYVLIAQPTGRYAAGPPVTREFEITPGEYQRVRLPTYLATVTVENPFRRAARIFIDGQPVGRVAPGAQVVVTDQLPGPHHVELRRHTRVLAETRIDVAPGAHHVWRPLAPRRGDLRVRNDTRRPLSVVVAGRLIGELAPGEAATVADLPPGPVVVVAEGPGHRRLRETVDIAPERTTHLALRAPNAGAGWGHHDAIPVGY